MPDELPLWVVDFASPASHVAGDSGLQPTFAHGQNESVSPMDSIAIQVAIQTAVWPQALPPFDRRSSWQFPVDPKQIPSLDLAAFV